MATLLREYEQPNLKWILSEMAVYPFLSDPRLIPTQPYYPEEKAAAFIPTFYNMKLEGAGASKRRAECTGKTA